MRRCLEELSKTPCCLVICVWYSAHRTAAIMRRRQFCLERVKKCDMTHKTAHLPSLSVKTCHVWPTNTRLLSQFLSVDDLQFACSWQPSGETQGVSADKLLQTKAKYWCEGQNLVKSGMNLQINYHLSDLVLFPLAGWFVTFKCHRANCLYLQQCVFALKTTQRVFGCVFDERYES